jgi:hypothetical protein
MPAEMVSFLTKIVTPTLNLFWALFDIFPGYAISLTGNGPGAGGSMSCDWLLACSQVFRDPVHFSFHHISTCKRICSVSAWIILGLYEMNEFISFRRNSFLGA